MKAREFEGETSLVITTSIMEWVGSNPYIRPQTISFSYVSGGKELVKAEVQYAICKKNVQTGIVVQPLL